MLGIILLAACHSESDFSGEGTAEVSLCLLADPSFVKTKAIDVLAYQNVDNYTVEHVTKLVANSKVTIEENEPALREAVHQYGRELIQMMFEHEEAIIATKEEITGIKLAGKKKHLIVLRTMYDEITKRGDCICIKDLDITGNDLMEYGLKGPEIGKTLNELLGVVIENPRLNDKATLIALIEHLN